MVCHGYFCLNQFASAIFGLILVCLSYSWFNLGLPWLFSVCLGFTQFDLGLPWLFLVFLIYISVYSCFNCVLRQPFSITISLTFVCWSVNMLSPGLSQLFSVCQDFCQIKKFYQLNPTKTQLNLTKTRLNS